MDFVQTIESDKLATIFELPKVLLGRQVEVIIRPIFDTAKSNVTYKHTNTLNMVDTANKKTKMSRAEMFGCMRGQFKMADDFDAPLDDFEEYMQ